jgi:glutathione S-transferase
MTAQTFTIWGRLNSHNVKKVAWFAEELGLNYVRHDVGMQFGFSEDYLAKNPNRLIPTIEDGKIVLWESNAILRYMASEYGGERWFPRDPIDRALADRWMDWQMTYAASQNVPFLSHARIPREQWDHAAIAKGIEGCARHLAVMDKYLNEKPWLSGDTFGIGDIPMGVYLNTWFALDFEKPEFAAVTEWFSRIRERPGFATQVMIPLT